MNKCIHRIRWLAVFFLSVSSMLQAEAVRDGGRDVSVLLFSARRPRSVTLTALDAGAWISPCATCARRRLDNPLRMNRTRELFAGGALKITDDESHEAKSATGLWRLRSDERTGVDVVLTLPSERYVAAVLNGETSPGESAASLQALAIVARTYALNGSHYTAAPGHLHADLCDSTQCQAMRLGAVSQAIGDAVRETTGETLWFRDERALAFFSQNCGGVTEDADSVWPRLRALPYLSSHTDPYCIRHSSTNWHAEISMEDLHSIAAVEQWRLPRLIEGATIVRRSASHRAKLVQFESHSEKATVDANALRFAIDRSLGWNQVRSDQYEIAVRHDKLVFDGRGSGHGVGLCQAGAKEMAAEGKSAADILSFYFRGTSVGVGPDDQGWRVIHSGALVIRSTRELAPGKLQSLEQSWKKAGQRFPLRRVVTPEIVFAPSVELFRQMTSQPGWVAASTSGARIVLAPGPDAGSRINATLLHEMLHVLVESEAGLQAPLWLREGLVEELAGDEPMRESPAPVTAINEALLHPASQAADAQAHRQAAARVHAMIARYGFSAVRGWLASGVPAGVS